MKQEKKYLDGTKIEDLRGMKFERLEVIDFDWFKYNNDRNNNVRGRKNGSPKYYWICRCDCGKCKSVKATHLKNKSTKSCGCLSVDSAAENFSAIKKESFYDWCIRTNNKILLEYWDYDMNTDSPNDVPFASEKEFYFRCINGIHGSELKKVCVFTKNVRPSKLWCEQCKSFLYWANTNISDNFIEEYIASDDLEYISKLRASSGRKIKIKCQNKSCSHVYEISCEKFKLGRRCPMCSCSIGENIISDILKSRSISYIFQKEFDKLLGINGGKLSYDFYLPAYNLLIEYQGEQHNKPIDYFGGRSQFKKQQEHDRRKREYAKKNSIDLLEIWYWDFDNIEYVLNEKLDFKEA